MLKKATSYPPAFLPICKTQIPFHPADLQRAAACVRGGGRGVFKSVYSGVVNDRKSHYLGNYRAVFSADDRYLLYLFQRAVRPPRGFGIYGMRFVAALGRCLDAGDTE